MEISKTELLQEWLEQAHFVAPQEIKTVEVKAHNWLSTTFILETLKDKKYAIKFYSIKAFCALQGFHCDTEVLEFLKNQEALIQNLFKSHLNIPRTLKIQGHFVSGYKDQAILIYEFIENIEIPINDYSLEMVEQIGQIVGKMHEADYSRHPEEYWQIKVKAQGNIFNQFLSAVGKQNAKIKPFFSKKKAYTFIDASVADVIALNLPRLDYHRLPDVIVTHFDVKPKNVIWQDTKHPFLIDWELLSLNFRTADVLRALFAFSCQEDHKYYFFNSQRAKAFLNGYCSIYKKPLQFNKLDLSLTAIDYIIWLNTNILLNNRTETDHCIKLLDVLAEQQEEILQPL